MDDRVVGVLGGGQLGRMLVEAAHRLNITVAVLDSPGAPAKQINALHEHVDGSFAQAKDIRKLAQECDILTVEIEHVDTEVLQGIAEGTHIQDDWRLVKSKKVSVQPSWKTIRVIQDKYSQKEYLMSCGIATTESLPIESPTKRELEEAAHTLGYPFMLKSRTEAYDGRGNFPVMSPTDISSALDTLKNRPLYAEKWAKFKAELAVMVVKTQEVADVSQWSSSTLAFPVVETIHEDSICKLVFAPARHISNTVSGRAQQLARRAVSSFWGKGVFGVEMFLLEDGEASSFEPRQEMKMARTRCTNGCIDTLLINEMAPRSHNSGHYTIEACQMSQYDAHLRAILDLPIPESGPELNTPDTHAIMLNILGGSQPDSHLAAAREALKVPGARVHLYGKGDARPGRKMGHITITASSMDKAEAKMQPLVSCVDRIRADRKKTPSTTALKPSTTSQRSAKPLVAITMGSDSDLPVLRPGIGLLDDLEIPYEVTITSAHRTPVRMLEFARDAASRGIKVIIAAAGGAAHLPGMIASSTPLPVIGVPVKGSTLDGMDSLLSIVQMPVRLGVRHMFERQY